MLDTLPGDLCMVSEEVCVIEVLLVSVGCGGFYFKVVVVGNTQVDCARVRLICSLHTDQSC